MNPISLRTFTPADISRVAVLQQAYTEIYPGAPVIPGELYLSPAFHNGADVFCAFESRPKGERLAAYAPVYAQIVEGGPPGLPHRIWTEIKAYPDLPDADLVKDLLLERVAQHARELMAPYPGRARQIIFEYRVNEIPAIEYVAARGFQYTSSVFTMHRYLCAPIPEFSAPNGVCIRRWKMESEAEQSAYVAGRNECFPEAPITLAEWQYYMQSPQWAAGTMIAAFSGAELVGAVSVYWNEEENRRSGSSYGSTEDIFVRAPWRGKGIASAAIAEGMCYLQEHGLGEAHLAVSEKNENALSLYLGLGYQVIQESRFYAKDF